MPATAPRDAVLLLTHSGDFYTVDLVAQALARMGVRPIRFNTDLFPSLIKISARAGDERATHFCTEGGEQTSIEEVRAVWARKLWSPRMTDDLDENYRSMCVSESVAALDGFLDALHSARWVNDLDRERAAENKQRQLRLATQAGLRVPRTLVTNDHREARQFFAETDGQTVAKLLRPLHVSMDASKPFVYTNRVREQDLAGADALRHCPMVFQELIPKARELRVAWVAGETFAGALDATGTSRGHTDWRRANPEECRWQQAQLPIEVSMDAAKPFVYTNRVREEDLAGAEALRHCPMVFQELIPKACELRVAYVAGETFAGALEATGTSRGHTDWRRAAPEECRWQKAVLPNEVTSGLQALMSELGLVFGAVDLICTPAGEHVFLEVNPSGEWGMLERDLDLPISEAIAEALLEN